MHIEDTIRLHLKEAIKDLFDLELPIEQIDLQPTRKEFTGTHTYVTFPLVRQSKKSPEQTAQMIGERLVENNGQYRGFNVVKGFLNLELKSETWLSVLSEAFGNPIYGQTDENGQKVMVEFSSPNTNKPLHLGHLRNIFLGDAMSRILSTAGYAVMKTNLVNDRGIHICKSMLAYQLFGAGETPDSNGIKGDHLVGKYYVKFDQELKKQIAELVAKGVDGEEAKKQAALQLEAQEMLKKWEDNDPETIDLWGKMNGWVYDGFDATYKATGITFDKIYYESNTFKLGKDLVNEGLQKGVFFKKPDGSVWVDLTGDGLDQKLVQRADGTSVYITQDMGTCELKYQDFPFEKSVYVVGNEQDYHFKVLFLIMAKLGRPYAEGLYHLSYGMVDLPSGKMKSREGTVVDADEIIAEMTQHAEERTKELGKIDDLSEEDSRALFQMLGLGALKYFLLRVDPQKRMLFNPEESIQFQGNTGPFIQYTHARIAAILRRAKQLEKSVVMPDTVSALHEREVTLIDLLSRFPHTVREAAIGYSPAVIAQYVYDLAKEYNGFYQEVSILSENDPHTLSFRLVLSTVTAEVINKGMGLLGITVPERM